MPLAVSRRLTADMSFLIEPLESRIALATFTLNTLADTGAAGSLRELILDANASPGADTIEIRTSGTIRLTDDLPAITDDLAIVVARGKTVTLDGRDRHQILGITGPGTDVTLENLKFANGLAVAGAALAIDTAGGVITVKNCTFVNNHAVSQFGAVRGGAIAIDAGTVEIDRSTFAGNLADGRSRNLEGVPHGSARGGVIWNAGTLTVTDSVLARNAAVGIEASGGAIFNRRVRQPRHRRLHLFPQYRAGRAQSGWKGRVAEKLRWRIRNRGHRRWLG
jgi:hypothetical protein